MACSGALGKEDKDIPTAMPYFADPAKATYAAMLICPGGGYHVSLRRTKGLITRAGTTKMALLASS